MSRTYGSRLAYVATLLLGFSLVACAEEETGPQFATDPRPTQPPTEAAASPPPALLPTAEAVATPASFTDLLGVRGAASTVYVASDNDVWSISSGGEATRVFTAPDGSAVRAIDPSPDAQEVAILLETASGQRQMSQALIADAAGTLIARVDVSVPTPATPVAAAVDGRQSIDWSPQGDRVLVQLQTGHVVEFAAGADAAPSSLGFGNAAARVVAPAWSPTGQSIAFISESEDAETRSLQVLDITRGDLTTAVTPLEGRLIVDFAWLPDGVSLLFTEGGVPGSPITGIDLWRVDANGENRALVVSAGTVAPVARIASLSPSPDGRSVAYAVLVPGSGAPSVDSVWVRSLASGIGFRIPMPSVTSVEGISWTDQGLVVSVVTSATAQGRPPTQALLLVKRDGSMAALWADPVPVATPTGATPVAAPASP